VRGGVILKQVLVTLFHIDSFIPTQATVIPDFDAANGLAHLDEDGRLEVGLRQLRGHLAQLKAARQVTQRQRFEMLLQGLLELFGKLFLPATIWSSCLAIL
jgi:hypothetical protein